MSEKISNFQKIYNEKKTQGYDVKEAEEPGRKAKQAFDEGDYKKADMFLNEAYAVLEKAKIPVTATTSPTSTPTSPASAQSLSRVKVAIVYESVTDPIPPERTTSDIIEILKETNTDMIFRGFWRWTPVPDSPETATNENYIKRHYTYKDLQEVISQIKKETPGIIFVGAIPAYKVDAVERNELTGEIIDKDRTSKMALDPAKWGIGVSKDEFQKKFGGSQEGWDQQAYYSDITNPEFQVLLLSRAKKMIDVGADAVWLDLLYSQAGRLEQITKDVKHPAVKESYDAASRIVDEIHNYGNSKGKYVYVGTWAMPMYYPYTPPQLDFVTESPTSDEILNKKFDEKSWSDKKTEIERAAGNISVFVFIDWGFPNSPLQVFSQKLNKEEQREFLKKAKEFFQSKGMVFVYPVHGGWMADNPQKRSFSQFRYYDSLAPEFETYETIKELSQDK